MDELVRLSWFDVKNVIQYPYRSKAVLEKFFVIDRTSNVGIALENQLAEKAKVGKDNHTVYEIETTHEHKLYIWCHDDEMLVGAKLVNSK